jgi:hypothetical protein
MNSRRSSALSGVRTTHIRDRRGVELVLRNSRCVEMASLDNVTVNLWRSREGGTVSVHLVDYGVDVRGEEFNQLANQVVRVRVDDPEQFDACFFIAPGEKPREVEFQKAGEELVAQFPAVEGYAVLAFANREKFEAANRAAVERRETDREKVSTLARRWNLY